MNADFQYATLDGTLLGTESVTDAPIGEPVIASIPKDILDLDSSYRWRVRARDTAGMRTADYSGWCEFTVATDDEPEIDPAIESEMKVQEAVDDAQRFGTVTVKAADYSDGRWIRPGLPRDVCGAVDGAAIQAIDDLPAATVVTASPSATR
ncbi:hypothetical protein [Actinoplanes sp. NPDC051851]|uniref:hypothetical protein n=1 Tax=Actinoplanes sp. NPDC051851 TaxID=3154753 RepID=UPI003440F11E